MLSELEANCDATVVEVKKEAIDLAQASRKPLECVEQYPGVPSSSPQVSTFEHVIRRSPAGRFVIDKLRRRAEVAYTVSPHAALRG